MNRKRAAGGILLLILAGILVAEALGPYLATTVFLLLSLGIVAVGLAIGGIFLLRTARIPSPNDLDGLPATVEDPHRPAPIRSLALPVTTGHGGFAPIGGAATYSERESDEDESD